VKPPFGRVLLRLFTVQASWNYERMQGVGFGVAEEPFLRELPGGQPTAEYRAALARGAHFFNAHPYLCGLAVGAAARAEFDGASPQEVERLRTALCGPLGSLGDRLVWAAWLPFASGLALIGVGLGLGWTAIVGFLLLYNAVHVALRWWALRAGWAYGTRVATALRQPFLQRAEAALGPGMALAMGAALPLAAGYLGGPFSSWGRATVAGVATIGFVLLRWRGLRVTGFRFGLSAAAVALVTAWVWR